MILGFPRMQQNFGLFYASRKCLYLGTSPRVIVHWKGTTRPRTPALLEVDCKQIGERMSEVLEVLQDFADVFQENLVQPTTKTVTHQIALSNENPIRQRPYNNSPQKRKVIRDEVRKMLESGVIRESASSFRSP